MTSHDEHEALLRGWSQLPRYKGRCFIKDGILDRSRWESAEHKVLFLLKEPYSAPREGKGWDLRERTRNVISEKGLVGTWIQAAYWYYACHHVLRGVLPSFPTKAEMPQVTQLFLSCAVVNVKKIDDGKKASSNAEIADYARENGDFIRKQVDLIQPKIIICGYTWPWVKDRWPDAHPLYDLALQSGDRIIVNFWHPANRYPHQLNYYAIGALVQNALGHRGSAAAA